MGEKPGSFNDPEILQQAGVKLIILGKLGFKLTPVFEDKGNPQVLQDLAEFRKASPVSLEPEIRVLSSQTWLVLPVFLR